MRHSNKEWDNTTEELDYLKQNQSTKEYIKKDEILDHANDKNYLFTMRAALEKAGFDITKED